MTNLCKLLLVAAVGCVLAGCSNSDAAQGQQPVYPVSGQVLANGQPLVGATVQFLPQQESLPSAVASTDEQGRFQLMTYEQGDGAVAGKHRITVKKLESVAAKEIEPGVLDPRGAVTQARSAIPTKYADPATSGLTAEVVAEGKNEVTLTLQ